VWAATKKKVQATAMKKTVMAEPTFWNTLSRKSFASFARERAFSMPEYQDSLHYTLEKADANVESD
jgi:hypothetical protein